MRSMKMPENTGASAEGSPRYAASIRNASAATTMNNPVIRYSRNEEIRGEGATPYLIKPAPRDAGGSRVQQPLRLACDVQVDRGIVAVAQVPDGRQTAPRHDPLQQAAAVQAGLGHDESNARSP
ncbi:hypothetical protein G6F59_016066 [Rhizopus arrhizus]|nr:hypothetical protein G6F59_016066 [Rhizopus arrhizus]